MANSSLSTLEAETELTLTPLSAAATEKARKTPDGLFGSVPGQHSTLDVRRRKRKSPG